MVIPLIGYYIRATLEEPGGRRIQKALVILGENTDYMAGIPFLFCNGPCLCSVTCPRRVLRPPQNTNKRRTTQLSEQPNGINKEHEVQWPL
jgi:hypothetical protein